MARRNNTVKTNEAEAEILTGVVNEDIETITEADEAEKSVVFTSIIAKIIRIENKSVWADVDGNGYIIPKDAIPNYNNLTVGQKITVRSDILTTGR